MYTRCIQNVSHISTNFCIHFVYKIKRNMAAKLYIQNVYKRLSKCGIHFVCILYTFCIHQFSSTKSVHHKNCIIRNVYNVYIQNSNKMYTNNCM